MSWIQIEAQRGTFASRTAKKRELTTGKATSMRLYLFAVVAGAIIVLAVFSGTVVLGERIWPSVTPPPAISGSVATDEKLRYLRARGSKRFDVLAVGSSITWMHVDGEPFESVGSILNGATANLAVHQIRHLTHFYLDMFPDISSVLMMTSVPDYGDCHRTPPEVMEETDARAYVEESYPTPYFYLRYFVPLRYLVRAIKRTKQQEPYYASGYWMDEYGTTPAIMDVKAEYDLRYPELEIDPACLEELGRLASDLATRDVDFTLIVTPVSPLYVAKFPGVDATVRRITEHAQGLGINVQNLYGHPGFDDGDFFDAFHMQWPAAQRLSREVARKLFVARVAETNDLQRRY